MDELLVGYPDLTREGILAALEFAADSVVQIAVLPGPRGSAARDWAVLGRIEIK